MLLKLIKAENNFKNSLLFVVPQRCSHQFCKSSKKSDRVINLRRNFFFFDELLTNIGEIYRHVKL